VAGQGLWVVPDGVADIAWDRGGQYDSEGEGAVVAKGDAIAQSRFINKLFGLAW